MTGDDDARALAEAFIRHSVAYPDDRVDPSRRSSASRSRREWRYLLTATDRHMPWPYSLAQFRDVLDTLPSGRRSPDEIVHRLVRAARAFLLETSEVQSHRMVTGAAKAAPAREVRELSIVLSDALARIRALSPEALAVIQQHAPDPQNLPIDRLNALYSLDSWNGLLQAAGRTLSDPGAGRSDKAARYHHIDELEKIWAAVHGSKPPKDGAPEFFLRALRFEGGEPIGSPKTLESARAAARKRRLRKADEWRMKLDRHDQDDFDP